MVRGVAGELQLQLDVVQPASWKKDVAGSGLAGYPTIRMCLASHFGSKKIQYLSEHEVAAIGIALSAARRMETAENIASRGTKTGG